MPILTKPDLFRRIGLIKFYRGLYSSHEIARILKEEHGIQVDERTIRRDIADIDNGLYKESFFEALLGEHLPKIYENVLQVINTDLSKLDKIYEDPTWGKRERLNALTNHAKLSLDLLDVLHKGPVIREMKRLSIRAKNLAREAMQKAEESRRNDNPSRLLTEIEPKILELDENLKEIKKEILKESGD